MSSIARATLVAAFMGSLAAACGGPGVNVDDADDPNGMSEALHTSCAAGETVFGTDVSKYDVNVDWPTVAAAGVKFSFVRASDGLTHDDAYFDANWAGTRANGILRGVYQLFRSNEDPIEQADFMLSHFTQEPGDLPPVLDVETTDGVSGAVRAQRMQQWLDRVEEVTGVVPIIYTRGTFMEQDVGAGDFSRYPLWHAQYTSAACPDKVGDTWSTWTFWQYSESGQIDGINAEAADLNVFNGNIDALRDFASGTVACGDGFCSPGEDHDSCADDCHVCEALPASGGVVGEDGPCFTAGGPSQFMRHVADAGDGGGLIWTHTTSNDTEANFGTWDVVTGAAGHYRVEAYTAAAYAQSTQAHYVVHHNGADDTFTIDQTSVDGWTVLAPDLAFAAGGAQSVHLGDNTGEAGTIQLVFDAIRLTRLDDAGEGEGDVGEGEGDVGEGEGEGDAGEGEGDGGEGDGGEGDAGEGEGEGGEGDTDRGHGCGGCASSTPATPDAALVILAGCAALAARSRRTRR